MGTVLLDFDGTIAHRPGMWSQSLVEALDDLMPGHEFMATDFRPHLSNGFPWDRPNEAHLDLVSPELWWSRLEPLFANAFDAAGVQRTLIPALSASVRTFYCDASKFELFPDSVRALTSLREAGKTLVILSNHVPELAALVEHLGLGSLIDEVFSSAVIGYEKPHLEAFRIALRGTDPSECYMVGDNPRADVLGAEQAGLHAILVRTTSAEVTHRAIDLEAAASLILQSS